MEARSLTDGFHQLLDRLDCLGQVELRDPATPVTKALAALGLLSQAEPTGWTECPGCEEACRVEPLWVGELPVVACGVREDVGLIPLSPRDLEVWRLDLAHLTKALVQAGGLKASHSQLIPGRLWRLGTAGSGRHRHTLYFAVGLAHLGPRERRDVMDVVGARGRLLVPHTVPQDVGSEKVISLVEVLELDEGGLFLDLEAVLGAPASAPAPSVPVVSTPTGVDWESVVLRIVDDEHVQVVVGDQVEVRSYQELGMVDRRRRLPAPNTTWDFLLVLARAGGSLSWQDVSATDSLRRRTTELRKALREALGIPGDPLHPYRPGQGWVPRFALVDMRERS